MGKKVFLDRDWLFWEKFQDEMIKSKMDGGTSVTIPHTCRETPFHYFDESMYQMVSAYQRVIVPEDSWQGKVVLLTFEGVGHETDVYLNGEHVGESNSGYTAFTMDISAYLKYGEENLLTVRVNSKENINQPPFGFVIDYMTYGGIYRDVYLTIENPVYIEDIFYQPTMEQVRTAGLSREEIQKIRVMGTVNSKIKLSKEGEKLLSTGRLAVNQFADDRQILGNAPLREEEITAPVSNASIWDVESPVVYELTTELLLDGELVDSYSAVIGFREAVFKTDGFYLNGRKFKIRGLNRHQSYPYVGYAMPESMQRYDAKILKEELGVNAVRTSHYPQSQYFIDECDKRGLLVFTEIPGWQHIGDEKWQDIAVSNVERMITQYRNHPSIIIWGVRINESEDNDAFYERTNALAHKLDPTRQTGGVRARTADKNTNIQEDVMTYNDFVHSGRNEGCLPKKKVTNDRNKPYLVTEYNGHMFPTKVFDSEEHRMEHMMRHANVLDAIAGEEDIAGSFAWCMFDYNTHKDFGSGDRICYHGVCDMFRNTKLAASLYQAQSDDHIVLDVSSSMDIGEHPACNRGDTYIISNADSVRMYKNGKLLKEYYPKDSKFKNMKHGPILINDYVGNGIASEEGYSKRKADLTKYVLNTFSMTGGKMTAGIAWAALRLVLFHGMNPNDAVPLYQKYVGDWGGSSKEYRFDAVKDGKVVKSIVKSPMTKRKMAVEISSTKLVEDQTYDVAEIRVMATDENENILNYFNEPLRIEVEGPLQVIGPVVTSFRGGLAGTYVKTIGEEGEAKVRLYADGMKVQEITFQIGEGENAR